MDSGAPMDPGTKSQESDEVTWTRTADYIRALGVDFDPNYHEAVVHEPSPDHKGGEVIEELRRGYMIGGRLLRPAMVKVAKPS